MKTITVHVDGSSIKLDSNYNPKDLFPGIQEPVQLEFVTSNEWRNRVKVAAFWSVSGREYSPRVLEDGKTCLVPEEALRGAVFKIQLFGKANKEKISTTKCSVYLKGGRP